MEARQLIASMIAQLRTLRTDCYHKNFLRTWDKPIDEIKAVVTIAQILEEMVKANIDTRCLKGSLAVSIFRDNSTRTRFSFSSAAAILGLTPSDLDEGKSQIAHGETVRETANMISFLTEVIGIRDDKFIGVGHEYQMQVQEAIMEGFQQAILPRLPCVVNLQCDEDHPTQSLADLIHLSKMFGGLENLRGKKIAMTWAYSPSYGKPLSVPQGIIGLLPRFGMEVVLAHPEGYEMLDNVLEAANKGAEESGGSFRVTQDMDDAFRNADIVYPKSWAPIAIMRRRVEGLGNETVQKQLESECLAMNAQHKDWECTEEKMALTKDGKALYMHCLPADITGVSCREGEVQASVFDRYRLRTYAEAGHKPYVIASMIMTSNFQEPATVLESMVERNERRHFD